MTINYSERPRPLAEHQYAVIDRKRVLELPENWPRLELVSPMLSPQAHLYPWLIPLHELPSEEWRSFIVALSQHTDPLLPPTCSLLLSSHCPAQTVRSALVSALYFKDEHQKGHILRYYDPRVLFQLHWMLNPWQLLNQLSAHEIPYWTFWLEGEWHSLVFPGHVAYRPGDNVDLPLQQLQRSGLINRVLQFLPERVDMTRRQEISRRIDVLVAQAVTCGLTSEEDRIAFALHGLQQRDGFWSTPKMAAFLAQARQLPDCYRDETNNWDENRWLEMTRPESRYSGGNH